jgi:hypothetical protein
LREGEAGVGDRLTRESSGQKVNGLHASPVNGGDVSVDRPVRPVSAEDALTVVIPLDKPASVHAGTLQAEVNATDA